MSQRTQRTALLAILILAAVLRTTGLAAGLRHTPHWDERVFVLNVQAMVEEKSLDHRYYEYPGLLFYILLPVFSLLPREALHGPEAYLAARMVITAFGVLSVALVYRLGLLYAGPGAGLAAALFLAVSPVEVVTAHNVRPDVALGALVLLAFLAFRRVSEKRRGDVLAGLAVGAATAVKFTGLLLVPSYLAARWLSPGPRLRRVLLAGVIGLGVVLLATPYAILHARSYLEGVDTQMAAHYMQKEAGPTYLQQLVFYARAAAWAFGPVGIGFIAMGVAATIRAWRVWSPLWLHPVCTVAVMSTADLRFERFLVPTAGVLAVLAGRGLIAILGRRPRLAVAAAVLAAVGPFWSSLEYARAVARPSSSDRALDWILEHVPEGSRVVTSLPELGLDTERYEVLVAPAWEPGGRIQSEAADILVATAGWIPTAARFETLFVAPGRQWQGLTLIVGRPPRRRLRPVLLRARDLSATENSAQIDRLLDDDLETLWQTDGPQRAGDALELKLPGSVRLARVELTLGDRDALFAENLHAFGTTDFATWTRLPAYPGRPLPERQVTFPPSQVLLFDPVPLRGLRLVQVGRRRKPWGAAELKVWAEDQKSAPDLTPPIF